jgi:hypothetical protein
MKIPGTTAQHDIAEDPASATSNLKILNKNAEL